VRRTARRSCTPAGACGFTLIEVLVALGIVAIALSAGLKATAALGRNAERQTDVMLAHMCAENELIKLRLARQLPGVGDTSSDCEQAGELLQVQTSVRPTPNPNFLRVDARVFKNAQALFQITTVMGRN
jgi:general secretion pathway protein I